MVIRMGEHRLELTADTKAFLDDQAWEELGANERLIRDTGLPFSPENVAWAKQWAARVAVYKTLVREGLLIEVFPTTGLLMMGRDA